MEKIPKSYAEYEYQRWQKILGSIMQSTQGEMTGTQVSLEDYGSGVQLPATKTCVGQAATMAEISRNRLIRPNHKQKMLRKQTNRAWKYSLVGLKTSDSWGTGRKSEQLLTMSEV